MRRIGAGSPHLKGSVHGAMKNSKGNVNCKMDRKLAKIMTMLKYASHKYNRIQI